ncbi:MAG: alanine racemase [Bifidobacteriaceae bacterium]|nr:alanine racemase [Bifidobacteriaceae bacterium]
MAAKAVINLDAIAANVHTLRARAGSGAAFMAVVKANGYGHGAVPVARAAIAAGAGWLGVAQVSEALEVVRGIGGLPDGVRLMTWIFGPNGHLREAALAGLDLGVSTPGQVEAAALAARAAGVPLRLHLKIDSGLGRAGAPPFAGQFEALVRAALGFEAEGSVRVVGVWSHFARADEPGHPSIQAQADAFAGGVALAERLGARLEVRHIANSAAVLTRPDLAYDLVRPGLAMYGLSPIPDLATAAELDLVPAMTLEASLATVKRLPPGHGVSYGHLYTVPDDIGEQGTVTGTVPLGYGDGIFRSASNRAPVQVGGRWLKIAGRVCMDQFVVDLGPAAPERAGDRVVLFGPGLGGEPTAQDWAEAAGTISYEITTRLPLHVPREYVGGGAARL